MSEDVKAGGDRITACVVQPHSHEWRVADDDSVSNTHLYLTCECGAIRQVPNRLPIEVPR